MSTLLVTIKCAAATSDYYTYLPDYY
jgi:hypothetical protein